MKRAQFLREVAGLDVSWQLDGSCIRTKDLRYCLIEALALKRFGRVRGYDLDGDDLGMDEELISVVVATADNESRDEDECFDSEFREELLVATGLKCPELVGAV